MPKKLIFVTAAAAICLGGMLMPPLAPPALAQENFFGETFSCESAAQDLDAEISGTQPPDSAGIIAQLKHVMWMLDRGMSWLDNNCRGEDNYAQVRASWQRSYNSAMNACRGMATAPSDCGPLRYRGY